MTDIDGRNVTGGVTGNVLVVDDERIVARVLARVLSNAGHQVTVCFDGAEAFSLLQKQPFDVVLADISMPNCDGIKLLRMVRGLDLELPVILVTGAPSTHSAIEAVEYGALRYLQKPIESAVLCETIERAIRLHQVGVVRREMLVSLGQSELHLSERAGLETRFERALAQLYMVFQPVVSWTAKSLFAYEALVRSREETLSQPRELFDAAERLNQLPELTYRIHAACAQQLKSLPEYALLFVNLHIKELLLVDEFARMSELVPYAGRVVLELTERASFEQVSDMSTRVARLRSYGFRIALDDMGAGFAGLTSFASLDPDVVKLDTVLIRDVDSMPLKRRLVSSMTRLCSELGIQVVAEGVETVNERDTLCELGCDLMQGYFFAQPSDTTVSPLVS